MLVETYEIEETKNEAALMACDAEASELITKLGLEGQQALLNPETMPRFPYRKMTAQEGFVYKTLCPVVTTLEKYKDGIIPLRVLQVASHVKDLAFVDRIQVWHPENADIKDPVLVGVKGPEYIDREVFILARWGEELWSMEKMLDLAKKMRVSSLKSALRKIKAEIIQDEETLNEEMDIKDLQNNPTYYRH